jgi:DNA-binding transcriptional regulator GbsR (MarR family)
MSKKIDWDLLISETQEIMAEDERALEKETEERELARRIEEAKKFLRQQGETVL